VYQQCLGKEECKGRCTSRTEKIDGGIGGRRAARRAAKVQGEMRAEVGRVRVHVRIEIGADPRVHLVSHSTSVGPLDLLVTLVNTNRRSRQHRRRVH
jgi:hypothetical protein